MKRVDDGYVEELTMNSMSIVGGGRASRKPLHVPEGDRLPKGGWRGWIGGMRVSGDIEHSEPR